MIANFQMLIRVINKIIIEKIWEEKLVLYLYMKNYFILLVIIYVKQIGPTNIEQPKKIENGLESEGMKSSTENINEDHEGFEIVSPNRAQ